MKINVSAKALQDAITGCSNVTGKPDNVNIKADKKGVWVLASGNDTVIKLAVEGGETISTGEITVPAAVVSGVIRGRGDLSMAADNKDSTVTFKSVKGGKYDGDFSIPPLNKIEVEYKEGKKEVKFSKDVQTIFEEAIKRVSISDVYSGDKPIYITAHCDKTGGTTVYCVDPWHVAHYHHPEVNIGRKNFSLPLSTFQMIQGLTKGKPYQISLFESQISARNEDMELTAPLVQLDKDQTTTVEQVEQYVAGLKKANGWMEVDKEECIAILNNCEAIYDSNVPLKIVNKGGKVAFSLETSYGKINTSLKGKAEWTKATTLVDPFLLRDILNATSEKTVTLNVIDGSALFFRVKAKPTVTTYATCLLQQ